MKVKDYIEQLQQLDPERDIWVIYDSFSAFTPEVEVVSEDTGAFEYINKRNGVHIGDYAIVVG